MNNFQQVQMQNPRAGPGNPIGHPMQNKIQSKSGNKTSQQQWGQAAAGMMGHLPDNLSDGYDRAAIHDR